MNHINRMKGKSHIIILIDTEKALDKIQYLFMLKTLDKVGTEGMYLNIIKTVYNKLTANVNLSWWWQFESSSFKIKTKEQDKDAHSHHSYSPYYWKP